MHMENRHKEIVLSILKKYPYTFYAFGSRVTGKQKKFSDLDLCFFEQIPTLQLTQLEEDFEESDLPFTVDLVDWNKCDEVFKKIISKNMVHIQGESSIPLQFKAH